MMNPRLKYRTPCCQAAAHWRFTGEADGLLVCNHCSNEVPFDESMINMRMAEVLAMALLLALVLSLLVLGIEEWIKLWP